jgi:hypothetical protein
MGSGLCFDAGEVFFQLFQALMCTTQELILGAADDYSIGSPTLLRCRCILFHMLCFLSSFLSRNFNSNLSGHMGLAVVPLVFAEERMFCYRSIFGGSLYAFLLENVSEQERKWEPP